MMSHSSYRKYYHREFLPDELFGTFTHLSELGFPIASVEISEDSDGLTERRRTLSLDDLRNVTNLLTHGVDVTFSSDVASEQLNVHMKAFGPEHLRVVMVSTSGPLIKSAIDLVESRLRLIVSEGALERSILGSEPSGTKKREAKTAHVKYVFLDVVGFTNDRTVEAMSDIVARLNGCVRGALNALKIDDESTILIPTGDGMCVGLVNVLEPHDVHVQLAVEILTSVERQNVEAGDGARVFKIRIGVNENVDNLVIDINGRANVAGRGVSMASRIMDKADGGQILVGDNVYETLRSREKYVGMFRPFKATAKHKTSFVVHQLLLQGQETAMPEALVEKQAVPLPVQPPEDSTFALRRRAAFVREVSRLRSLIETRKKITPLAPHVGTVMAYMRSGDTVDKAIGDFSPISTIAPDMGDEDLFDYYDAIPSRVILDFANLIGEELFRTQHGNRFAKGRGGMPQFSLPNADLVDEMNEWWEKEFPSAGALEDPASR